MGLPAAESGAGASVCHEVRLNPPGRSPSRAGRIRRPGGGLAPLSRRQTAAPATERGHVRVRALSPGGSSRRVRTALATPSRSAARTAAAPGAAWHAAKLPFAIRPPGRQPLARMPLLPQRNCLGSAGSRPEPSAVVRTTAFAWLAAAVSARPADGARQWPRRFPRQQGCSLATAGRWRCCFPTASLKLPFPNRASAPLAATAKPGAGAAMPLRA